MTLWAIPALWFLFKIQIQDGINKLKDQTAYNRQMIIKSQTYKNESYTPVDTSICIAHLN